MKKLIAILFFLVLTAVIVYGVIRPQEPVQDGPAQPTTVLFPSSSTVPVAERSQTEEQIKSVFYADSSAAGFATDAIAVSGDFALTIWSDENTGGMALFRHEQNGNWTLILSDGGALSRDDLLALGVPQANATELISLLSLE
jgi:hypothetical protein